ncbi:MAG: DinB family protein [Acidobacteria bacterium]|nr:DinB family protein [Acidobacteriota bacterium]
MTSPLQTNLTDALVERYTALAQRTHDLAAPLSEEQFWKKPFAFGNSFGHLVLHLTGNLSYYIGAQIAGTGYVREREREFTETQPPSKQEALNRFSAAIEMVGKTLRAQTAEDWSLPYAAKGVNAPNRLAILLQCATHLDHHVGQMIWLAFALGHK